MTNHVWIPKKRGILYEYSAEIRGYCQDALSGMGFISLLNYWVMPLHSYLVFLSSSSVVFNSLK